MPYRNTLESVLLRSVRLKPALLDIREAISASRSRRSKPIEFR
jgi:hypothetical protein